MHGNTVRLVTAIAVVSGFIGAATGVAAAPAAPQTGQSPAPGLLGVITGSATYPPYGQLLIPGCQWATWVTNCSNLGVYSNGGSFGNATCGAPNGCTYGPEFQCVELAQRYASYAWGEPDYWFGYGGADGDAAQMWQAGPALPKPLMQFVNGGGVAPRQGDVMVFGPGWIGTYWDGSGHVAVVSDVGSGYLDIVEQNGSATGTDRFALNGATVAQPNGFTPLIGWMRPVSWAGPIDRTAAWGGSGASSAPSILVTPAQQLVFWQGTDNHLWQSWYAPGASWNGPVDWTALWHNTGTIASPPSVTQTPAGQTLVFWQGTNSHLWQAWYTPGLGWAGPVDWSAQWNSLGLLASAPTLIATAAGPTLAFWQGVNNDLWEAMYVPGTGWKAPVDRSAQLQSVATLASTPSLTQTAAGQTLAFWRGTNNHLWEAWDSPGSGWSGPTDWTALWQGAAPIASTPSVVETAAGQTFVFWQGGNNHVWQAWYSPAGGWSGPVDWTAQWKGPSAKVTFPIASTPSVTQTAGGETLVFWQGGDGHLWESWYAPGSGWTGPVDQSTALGAGKAAALASAPNVVATATAGDLIFWEATGGHILEAIGA